MAIVNRQHGFLWLAEPYSASRTLRERLLKLPGSQPIGSYHSSLATLIDRGLISPDEIGNTLRVFSVIRHPVQYLVTQFCHLSSWHYAGFDKFVRCELANKTTVYRHAADATDHIRFANLHEDLIKYFGEIDPVVNWPLPNRHPTEGRADVLQQYTPELQDFIISKLTDFDRYGFTLDRSSQ
jgi:hypothetical protein